MVGGFFLAGIEVLAASKSPVSSFEGGGVLIAIGDGTFSANGTYASTPPGCARIAGGFIGGIQWGSSYSWLFWFFCSAVVVSIWGRHSIIMAEASARYW